MAEYKKTAGAGGSWGTGVETQCNGNFLECNVVIPMKIPSNGTYRVTTRHHLSPGKAFFGRTGLHSIELLAKRVPWKLPKKKKTQSVAETKGCSIKMDSRVPLPKITPTRVIGHRESN